MNSSLLAALGTLCFGMGWWVDSRFAGNAKPAAGGHRLPAAVEATVSPGFEKPEFATSSRGLETVEVHNVSDLLKLTQNVPSSTARARAELAIAKFDAEEIGALVMEIRALLKAQRNTDFPREIMNPLLRRWLTLDPVPALEFGIDFNTFLNAETNGPWSEAMLKTFASDLPAATRLMAKDDYAYIDMRWHWIKSLAGTAPAEALAKIVAFDAKTGNARKGADYLGDFPEQWIQSNPRQAMDWALSLPPTHTRREMLGEMAREWSKRDVAAYQAYLNAVPLTILPTGNLREQLVPKAQKPAVPP
jgi:hypothetical protein